jgi:hypothetical protein
MLSERSPGSADASRSIPMVEPGFMEAIGALRLRKSPSRRTRASAQDDTLKI